MCGTRMVGPDAVRSASGPAKFEVLNSGVWHRK
jgi:hypothetical protein